MGNSIGTIPRYLFAFGAALAIGMPVSCSWAASADALRARAARGESSAQFDLAIELIGQGKKDEARIWLDAAAQNGHPKARAFADAMSDARMEETGRATAALLPDTAERAPSEHPSAAGSRAASPAAAGRVAWTGDLTLEGSFTKDVPLFKQSGNKMKLNLKQATDARNTREQHEAMRLTLRKDESGELLLETGMGCVGKLFERTDRAGSVPREARGMRGYDIDYAVMRASQRCAGNGRRKGEQTVVYLGQVEGGYDVYLRKSWEGEGNTGGRGELDGRGVLRPIEVAAPRAAMASSLRPAPTPMPVQPLPTSSMQGLPAVLDNALIRDSRSWMSNHYDIGSVSDTRVLAKAKDGRPAQLAGNYSYNGGMRGWIKVNLSGDTISCIELHDFAGQCRPLGRPGSNGVALGIMTMMMADAVGGGAGVEQGPCNHACEKMKMEADFSHQQHILRQNELERQRIMSGN